MELEVERQWSAKINVYGQDFDWLKKNARECLLRITEARSFKEISFYANGGSDLEITCPVQEKINQLRKEADELEATLSK